MYPGSVSPSSALLGHGQQTTQWLGKGWHGGAPHVVASLPRIPSQGSAGTVGPGREDTTMSGQSRTEVMSWMSRETETPEGWPAALDVYDEKILTFAKHARRYVR